MSLFVSSVQVEQLSYEKKKEKGKGLRGSSVGKLVQERRGCLGRLLWRLDPLPP